MHSIFVHKMHAFTSILRHDMSKKSQYKYWISTIFIFFWYILCRNICSVRHSVFFCEWARVQVESYLRQRPAGVDLRHWAEWHPAVCSFFQPETKSVPTAHWAGNMLLLQGFLSTYRWLLRDREEGNINAGPLHHIGTVSYTELHVLLTCSWTISPLFIFKSCSNCTPGTLCWRVICGAVSKPPIFVKEWKCAGFSECISF